jgi:hypothetical protein
VAKYSLGVSFSLDPDNAYQRADVGSKPHILVSSALGGAIDPE